MIDEKITFSMEPVRITITPVINSFKVIIDSLMTIM